MASHFGSVLQHGERWRGRYQVAGKRYYTPTRKTKAAVRRDLVTVEAAIIKGEWIPPAPRRRKSKHASLTGADCLYVREYAQHWLATLKTIGRSPNTIRSYTSMLNAHITPAIGHMRLADVTDQAVRAVAERMADKSPTSRINATRCLISMLTSAKEEGKITEVPTPPVIERGAPKREKRALTADQLDKVIANAQEEFQTVFALAAWCALRYSEVAALRPKDINLQAWTVTVRRGVKRDKNGGPVEGPPKSRASMRTVSIPKRIQPLVAGAIEEHRGGPDDLLFSREGGWGGQGYLSDRVLRAELERACKAAGVKPIVFHELRHTGLTLFGQAGATLADLMYRAGHATADTVMIYQHSTLKRDAELAEQMG